MDALPIMAEIVECLWQNGYGDPDLVAPRRGGQADWSPCVQEAVGYDFGYPVDIGFETLDHWAYVSLWRDAHLSAYQRRSAVDEEAVCLKKVFFGGSVMRCLPQAVQSC